jgi:hypothetical protein
MPRFEVLAGQVLIGHSELDHGDPPMGVAAGRFMPTPEYAIFQPLVIATRDGSQLDLTLRVLTPDGRELARDGQVQILDFSPELGPDGMEVQVLGIESPTYAELFPTQAAAFAVTRRDGD